MYEDVGYPIIMNINSRTSVLLTTNLLFIYIYVSELIHLWVCNFVKCMH